MGLVAIFRRVRLLARAEVLEVQAGDDGATVTATTATGQVVGTGAQPDQALDDAAGKL